MPIRRLLLLLCALLIVDACSTANIAVPPTGRVYAQLIEVRPLSGFSDAIRAVDERPRYAAVFRVGRSVREAYAIDSPVRAFHGAYEVGEWYKITRTTSGGRWRLLIQQKGRGL